MDKLDKENFYAAKKIDGNVTAIQSKTGEIMYLVEGKEKAVLIDTCLGVGHLKEFVGSLTEKPVTVILTHGHVDHAMGAPEFERVYMNHKDYEVFIEHSPLKVRKDYLAMSAGKHMPEFREEDFVQPVKPDFHDLRDGEVFDLGELHAEAYALPGHTPGSMIILIREKRILILGDACNTATFLFDAHSLSVEEYRENLIQVNEKLKGRYDCIFLCHHVMEACPDIAANVIEVCDEIMEGVADDIPFDFMGETQYIAKACNERFERKDGKEGNIIYHK